MTETPNPPDDLEESETAPETMGESQPTEDEQPDPGEMPADGEMPVDGDLPVEEGLPVEGEPPLLEDMPGTTIPTSTYEMVVVAAREARRLNNRLRRLTDERPEKVTSRAIERVLAGQVRFAYDDTHSS